jgi:hypothetical protein
LANDLDPVAIRVQHECDVAHTTVAKLLLELVARILEALTCSLQVIDRDAEMSKALVRFRVAIGDLIAGVVFSAVVVRKLDDALAVGPMLSVRGGLWAVIREEVEIEFGIWILQLLDLLKPKKFIEFDTSLRILDADPN